MNKKYPKKNHVTEPNIISKYYFNFMKNKIIEVGNFHEKKNVLDYGCGTGDLKKLNLQKKNKSTIINYDIIEELSEIKDWREINFDTIVFCQVLVLIEPIQIRNILDFIKRKNSNVEIITVISSQSIINKIGGIILGHFDSHGDTKTEPTVEKQIFNEKCSLIHKSSYFNLFEILKFKLK